MPPPRGGESKQGLIITLVFFILLSIILGVFVYLGFAGQDDLASKAKKADEEKKNISSDRDFQKFKALVYQAYMGHTPKSLDDLGTLRGQYDQKTLKGGNKDDQEEVAKLLALLDKNLGWNAAQKKPTKTYLDQVKRLEGDLKTAQDTVDERDKQIAQLKKGLDDINRQLAKAKADYKDDLEKTKKDLLKDLDTLRAANDQQRKDFGDYSKEREALELKFKQYQESIAKQMQKKDKDISGLKIQLDKALETTAKSRPTALDFNRPRGRIALIDRTGESPFINLGSADNVKPQLTFAIHGQRLDGTPIPTPKGSLEVVYVLGEHLSQCRVTGLVDANRDPIVKGDYLFNPTWDPNQKQHVSIAGIIDLYGNARRERPAELNRLLMEFKRGLEHQGIIVDAWLDLQTLEVKGTGISRQTDFLIVGDAPDLGDKALRDEDPKAKRQTDVFKALSNMQDEAMRNGATVVHLRKFLAISGYRVPRGMTRDRPDSFQSDRPPEEPKEPKEPPKKDGDKPKNGDKGEKQG